MPHSQGFTLGYYLRLPPGGNAFMFGRYVRLRVRLFMMTEFLFGGFQNQDTGRLRKNSKDGVKRARVSLRG
jgi:hypothetical protein